MSFKNVPIPAAAEAAGMTNLVFAEDFESETAIDFSGEGKEGYSFYADRPYALSTLTPEDCQMRDSVLYFCPEKCPSAIGLVSYSKAGRTGFLMRYGYAEARIRADLPTGEFNGVPAFWTMEKKDMMGEYWERCAEIDILELVVPKDRPNDQMIYTGTLHEHFRTGKRNEKGRYETKYASNWVNNCGYLDQFTYMDDQWHTYGALWEPGYVAWYLDGKLMHSARFNDKDLPQYYHRDDPNPLPRIEETTHPHLAHTTWPGAHSVTDTADEIIVLGCNKNWPMEVDWVRVWQK